LIFLDSQVVSLPFLLASPGYPTTTRPQSKAMGCSNSTHANVVNKDAPKPEAAAKGTLLGAVESNNIAAVGEKVAGVEGKTFEVGTNFDTPYGKGTLEELKQREGMTYAIVKLVSGFVSVPQEAAQEWYKNSESGHPAEPLNKVGKLEVGQHLQTPAYGKGIVDSLKPSAFEDGTIYAIIQLSSGFVSVPAFVAESWMENAAASKEEENPAANGDQLLPVATATDAAAQEPETVKAPFSERAPQLAVEERNSEEVAALESEVIAAEGRGFNCGKAVKVTQACSCAEGFHKPQVQQVQEAVKPTEA